MIQKIDLAALAEGIEAAYRPIPLATSGELSASLFVCQGKHPWQRREAHDELLLVVEGVITLEGPTGKVVVNEGDLASAPRNAAYSAHSGMRSSVVLLEAIAEQGDARNGHHPPEDDGPGSVDKTTVAVDVRKKPAFTWEEVGSAGHHVVMATRLVGTSVPYRVSHGSVFLVVFRGVLKYKSPEEAGSVVGSQMLVLSEGTQITLHSGRGATVLFVAPVGASVPAEAVPGAETSG